MNSTKCVECGFVGWSDLENCKACGAPLNQRSTSLPLASPGYDSWDQPEQSQKKGLAIFSLVLGILSFLTFGLVGIGAILGIILAVVAMVRAKREPWKYGRSRYGRRRSDSEHHGARERCFRRDYRRNSHPELACFSHGGKRRFSGPVVANNLLG